MSGVVYEPVDQYLGRIAYVSSNCSGDSVQTHTLTREASVHAHITLTGAGPGYPERGFICIKVLDVRFTDFILFFLDIP